EHVRTDAGCRGGCPDQVVIVIASRVTVLQLHILSRKFPPFLGFFARRRPHDKRNEVKFV
ncbi:hypothetical protein ACD929_23650, partial [Escherichia coli]